MQNLILEGVIRGSSRSRDVLCLKSQFLTSLTKSCQLVWWLLTYTILCILVKYVGENFSVCWWKCTNIHQNFCLHQHTFVTNINYNIFICYIVRQDYYSQFVPCISRVYSILYTFPALWLVNCSLTYAIVWPPHGHNGDATVKYLKIKIRSKIKWYWIFF